MPHLLLFAAIREAAGTGRAEIAGTTVTEVVEQAKRQFGDDFTALLPFCKTYVQGEPISGDMTLTARDEVALLPPVSGGCA